MTTGSLVVGLQDGVARGLGGYTGSPLVAGVNYVNGDPDGVLTATTGSDLAIDSVNGQHYMAKCAANGSTWIKLGSVA